VIALRDDLGGANSLGVVCKNARVI